MLPGLKLAHGTLEPAWPHVVEIGGRAFPIMSFPYIGALKTYLTFPLWLVFEPSPVPLRALTAALGLPGIILAWALARRVAGPTAAGIAALLLSSDPTYVLAFKHDAGPVALAFLLRTGVLLLLFAWWRSRSHWELLVAAGALAGLGLWNKLDFLWFLLALLPLAGVLALRGRLAPGQFLAFAVPAALGAVPLLWFNWASHGATFQEIVGGFTQTGPQLASWPPLRVVLNLVTLFPGRMGMLETLLDGSAMPTAILGEPPVWRSLAPILVLTAAAWAAIRGTTGLRLLLGLGVAMVLATSAIGNTDKIHHLFNVYPLPHLLAGAMLAALLARRRPAWRAAAATAVAVVVGSNAFVLADYSTRLEATGGAAQWSDALYQLADSIATNHCGQTLVAVDWGIDLPAEFLTNDRCPTVAVFAELETENRTFLLQQGSGGVLLPWLERPDVLFAVYADSVIPAFGSGRSRANFWNWLNLDQANVVLPNLDWMDMNPPDQVWVEQEQFAERDGRPVLSLVRVHTFSSWVRYLADGGQLKPPPEVAARLARLRSGVDFRIDPSEDQLGLGWFPVEAPGPFAFRWIGIRADLYLKVPDVSPCPVAPERMCTSLHIVGERPPELVLEPRPAGPLALGVNRGPASPGLQVPLGVQAGSFEIRLFIPVGTERWLHLRLEPEGTFQPGGGDRRQLGLMIRSITLE
ncbi:MAG: hypothetical protein EXR58_05795 [Chloroflexi bacterium]|nr:hypothetical protein [Chloroflexota bacterium]